MEEGDSGLELPRGRTALKGRPSSGSSGTAGGPVTATATVQLLLLRVTSVIPL